MLSYAKIINLPKIMKNIKIIAMIVSLSCLSAIAQNQNEINPLDAKLELQKINKFLRSDANEKPYKSQEIQRFVDYIAENPLLEWISLDNSIYHLKVDVAQSLYWQTQDPSDKKKLVDLLIKTFPLIQVARDKLGVNPLSEDEGWLYVAPQPPLENLVETDSPMEASQRWGNWIIAHDNKILSNISELNHLHRHLYITLTEGMKVKIEGVPQVLERSPEEKARTKEMLEKQAAAHGRKKPEPKEPEKD
jgi:hypothetical protein